MGKFFDTLKKAGSDAVKSISDQLHDAGENIKNTTKDALGNIKSTTVGSTKFISTAAKNNFISTAVKNAAAPLKEKLQNFSINTSLGAMALLPFKYPMVSLLKSKGVEVSNSDSINKITLLFYDQIVKGKNNLEYSHYEHAEEGGDSGVDWGKICMEVLGFCKKLWEKDQEKKEQQSIEMAQMSEEIKKKAQENIDAKKTPLDVFAETTMEAVINPRANTSEKFDFKKLLPVLFFVGACIVIYKIFKH